MDRLSKDWLFEKHIDLEYKSYVLMAYLQHVSKAFEVQRLYPHLADLVEHYNALLRIRKEQARLEHLFPKELKGVRPDLKLQYEQMARPETLEEIIEIIEFAIPLIEKPLKEGKEIYDELEKAIHVSSVGILPLQTDVGYLLIRNGGDHEMQVYDFKVTLFENPQGKYRAIRTSFRIGYQQTLSNTPEQIKLDLLHRNREWPNPVTLVVESEQSIPFEQTFFPIAKRSVVKYLAAAA